MTTPRPAPVLVTACANEVKAVGGSIWLIQKFEFGLLMRCEINRRQLRVVLFSPGLQPSAEIPIEANSQLHVVSNLSNLRDWLKSICVC